MITSLRGDFSLFMLINTYFIKLYSLIRYGAIESVRVLKIQKMALRTIKGLNKRQSCRPVLKELQILTVTALYLLTYLLTYLLHGAESFLRS